MGKQAATQFRLEPSGLGWHDFTGIGHFQYLVNLGGIHIERAGSARIYCYFKLSIPANSTYELDALAGARIVNPQQGSKYVFLQQRHIQ